MKKIKYGFLLLCFVFLITGCEKKQEEQVPVSTTTPLLLEVSKEEMQNKLYLFGSIHAGDESLYPFPDYVLEAYRKSRIVAVEFDLIEYEKDLERQTEMLANFVHKDGTFIQDYIDEETYTRSVEILKSNGLYNALFDYYTPMMWQMLLENAVVMDVGLKEQYGVDKEILKLSKEEQKEILELESPEIQYDILLGFDEQMQIYLLERTLEEYDDAKEEMKQLYELYKKGNKEELESLLFESEEETNSYLEEYNDQLITKRNQNMATSLEEVLQQGKDLFCTVGLAHIVGDGGIADLLEQKGYSVKIVH